MENSVSKMVSDLPKVNYSELEVLLKEKNSENKKKFIEGYMSYLYKNAYDIYNTYKSKNDSFEYFYEFDDFFSDAIEVVIDKYNKWNFVENKTNGANMYWFGINVNYKLLYLLDKKQKEISAREADKSLSEIDLRTNLFEDIMIDKMHSTYVLDKILEIIDERFSDKKKAIVYKYFGIGEDNPKSCEDTANEFNVSRAYVGAVKQRAQSLAKYYVKKNERIFK